MTVIKYDENVNIHDLIEIGEAMRDRGYDVIAVPSSVDLMVEATAEMLFGISDQIWVALEKIREERPEEYKKAYNNIICLSFHYNLLEITFVLFQMLIFLSYS